MSLALFALVAGACATVASGAVVAPPATAEPVLPPGFTWTAQPSGQDPFQLTDFVFLPNGGLISTAQAGDVTYVTPDGTARVLLTIPVGNVEDSQLGVLSIALANDYATSGDLYIFYSTALSSPDAVANLWLGRFTADDPTDPTTLAEHAPLLDAIPSYTNSHAGGAIVVAPDGTLFVAVGETATFLFADPLSLGAQDLNDPHGKILHLNPDGSGVSTNPFYAHAPADSWESRVYAYGFREPFRMSMRPATGTLYVGEVGWNRAEEIDVVQPGGNYGWPCWEGFEPAPISTASADPPDDFPEMAPCTSPNASANSVVAPLWAYGHGGVSSAVTGGIFSTGSSYPEQYRGAYFFGDYQRSRIWTLATDDDDRLETGPGSLDPSTPFGSSIGGPTRFRSGLGGDVYVADLVTGNIWHLGYTAPTGPTLSPIALRYLGLGGPRSFLGEPAGPEHDVAGGRVQTFAGGSIYWSAATGAHEVHGSILGVYLAVGGPSSLGFPTTDESATMVGGGRFNHFTGGSIYWSPSTGAHEVHGAIRDEWASVGWEFGFLGFPISDETSTWVGNGRFTRFQGGSIYWSPATGAHEVHGAIRDEWASVGWEFGFLGFPVTDETVRSDGVGRSNGFQGGAIFWSPSTGAHEVHGAIGVLYQSLGGPSSPLGYPVSDEGPLFGGRLSAFERGAIYWSPSTGAVTVG